MVRKQVYIEPRQERLLKQRAKDLGVTEAALIRRGIDNVVHVSLGFPLDQAAWEEEKAYIQKYRRSEVPQTGRAWTRDELYDERLQRFSR